MEPEKRKRRDVDGVVERKRPKDDDDDGGGVVAPPSVTEDDEVEEFFAILRRIHVAASYFKGRDGAGRDSPAESRRSLAVVEKREEVKVDDVYSAESHSGLDLNLDPPTKDNSS